MSLAFSAVLLAAGHSTRMGRDKALLPAPDGGVLWQRQREVLARAGAAEIFLSARPDQSWAAAARDHFAAIVHDQLADAGPLAGVVAALERASHAHLAVLAIDLPRMQPEWFAMLLPQCAGGVGAVGRRGDMFEPLAAVYPRELLRIARPALDAGAASLQRLLATGVAENRIRVVGITAAEAPWFENWNEPGVRSAKTWMDVNRCRDV